MNPTVPDSVTIPIGNREIRIDLGELVLPGIVLVFGVLYYFGTRGLPELSMQYSGPLLYITMALAIVTIAEHAIIIGSDERTVEDYRKERQTEREETEGSQGEYFNRKSAVGLVVISLVYLVVLTQSQTFLGELSFALPTALFLGATLYLFGERRLVYLLVYSIGFALLTWSVFINWLRIPL